MSEPVLRWHEAADREALAESFAAFVAGKLAARVAISGRASLAVSGGHTPSRFFEKLSQAPIPWGQVLVTLIDERWVDESSDRSNGALVRQHLLQGPAAAATFVPLYTGDSTPEDGFPALEQALDALSWPLTVAILGMGDDGHTASYFPHGDGLAAALSPPRDRRVAEVSAAAAVEPAHHPDAAGGPLGRHAGAPHRGRGQAHHPRRGARRRPGRGHAGPGGAAQRQPRHRRLLVPLSRGPRLPASRAPAPDAAPPRFDAWPTRGTPRASRPREHPCASRSVLEASHDRPSYSRCPARPPR